MNPFEKNPFEVLEISVAEIKGKDEKTIKRHVNSKYTELHNKTTGPGANIPRPDGLSNTELQELLKAAKNTLQDPQERRKLIAELNQEQDKERKKPVAAEAWQFAEIVAEAKQAAKALAEAKQATEKAADTAWRAAAEAKQAAAEAKQAAAEAKQAEAKQAADTAKQAADTAKQAVTAADTALRAADTAERLHLRRTANEVSQAAAEATAADRAEAEQVVVESMQAKAEAKQAADTAKQAAAEAEQAAAEAERAAAKAAFAKQAEAAKQALKPVVAAAVKYLVNYAEIISAVGITLMVLGIALTGFGVYPLGPAVKWLGDLVFPFGFTAFLYKGSGRRAVVFGAVGIVLMSVGLLVPALYGDVLGGLREAYSYLAESSFKLSIVVLVCGLASFLLRESRYTKVIEVARPITGWWMAMTARLRSPLIRMGCNGMAIGLFLVVPIIILEFLFGAGALFGWLPPVFFLGGILLIVIGFLRDY